MCPSDRAGCVLVRFAGFAVRLWPVVICSWWSVSFPGFEKMPVRPAAWARSVTEGSVQF